VQHRERLAGLALGLIILVVAVAIAIALPGGDDGRAARSPTPTMTPRR
jgi:hypothetical protein